VEKRDDGRGAHVRLSQESAEQVKKAETDVRPTKLDAYPARRIQRSSKRSLHRRPMSSRWLLHVTDWTIHPDGALPYLLVRLLLFSLISFLSSIPHYTWLTSLAELGTELASAADVFRRLLCARNRTIHSDGALPCFLVRLLPFSPSIPHYTRLLGLISISKALCELYSICCCHGLEEAPFSCT
jgi:hypothetical protein